jgi:hypothetical protein
MGQSKHEMFRHGLQDTDINMEHTYRYGTNGWTWDRHTGMSHKTNIPTHTGHGTDIYRADIQTWGTQTGRIHIQKCNTHTDTGHVQTQDTSDTGHMHMHRIDIQTWDRDYRPRTAFQAIDSWLILHTWHCMRWAD